MTKDAKTTRPADAPAANTRTLADSDLDRAAGGLLPAVNTAREAPRQNNAGGEAGPPTVQVSLNFEKIK